MRDKILNCIKENWYATIYIVIMSLLYVIMMFINKPWYDELYTYYSFISRGPVYAAIHWPVPNNHVGYSVISACLNIFGNSYISLRGISCVAAIANLILIYNIGCRIMKKPYAFFSMVMYSGANMVYMLSIQGRGYTLAITCYLVGIIAIYRICMDEYENRYYIVFALSLVLGLYILPSSLYWVVPLSACAGIYLLLKKDWKKLINLTLSGIAAAIGTVFLYMLIWLAIGSNLLSKNVESEYYGIYQVKIILRAPILAAKTGIEYMLATPYIQSIDKKSAIMGMPGYFEEFFSQCYSYFGIFLSIVMVFLIVFFIYYAILEVRFREKGLWVGIIISGSLLFCLLMLIIQSVHPYKRVLSFIMVPMSLGVAYALSRWTVYSGLKAKWVRRVEIMLVVFASLFVAFRLTTYDYRRPLADRENNIEEALKAIDVNDIDTIYYTDDYQKYVLKFYHNCEPEEVALEEARYVLIGSELTSIQYKENEWPLLLAYDKSFLEYVEDNFEEIAITEAYSVFCRK